VLNGDFHDTLRDSAAPLHLHPGRADVCSRRCSSCWPSRSIWSPSWPAARRWPVSRSCLLCTLAGAMPRHAVGWLWFALAALGYLLLLSSDARDEVSRLGTADAAHGRGVASCVKALSARRIAVIRDRGRVAIPLLLLPIRKSNLLADAIHGGTGIGGGGG